MALDVDAECQGAIDLAKSALPEGSELDVAALLAAVYYATHVRERLPRLARYLPAPEPRRATRAKVAVAKPLQPILETLAQSGRCVVAEDLFAALVRSADGRRALIDAGLSEAEIGGLLTPPEASHCTGWRGSPERDAVIQTLNSFGRMLTSGEPPNRGTVEREDTLRSLVRTLCKMKRRNAVLVGAAGTGKSAIIYELARRLVHGHESIPPRLRDMDIFELSPAFLRSGASMVGQYDERVKSLIETLQSHPNVILFVDELHSLFHSGVHGRDPFTDANESFKGVLGRGEITCIGCTTPAEYRFAIEPDEALVRRFSVIRLEPPSREATLRILSSRRPRMEKYFSPLRIPDAVLQRAVDLSDDYLPHRFQPDKAIQLLDESCAWCATTQPPLSEVTEAALMQALEDLIGHSIVRHETLTEEGVYETLRAKIVGQDDLLRGIARAFVAGLGGWRDGSGPRGVFLFGGPTGVGKTEVALLLARILGDSRDCLVRVDCNTLQGSGHDSGPVVNRLLGVPPGYVGYARGQGGLLSRVRDLPESVVLFDEFEKADPGVGELLLRILDEGQTEDVDGNRIDFRRSFIVFTTNAGCRYGVPREFGFSRSGEGAPGIPTVDDDALKAELRAVGLGEEFLGRIHHVFLFKGLDVESIARILERQLERLGQSAELRNLRLEWEPQVVSHLAAQWQPRFGVRHLTTMLNHRVQEQLSVAEAQGEMKDAKVIRLRVMNLAAGADPSKLVGLVTRARQGDALIISLA